MLLDAEEGKGHKCFTFFPYPHKLLPWRFIITWKRQILNYMGTTCTIKNIQQTRNTFIKYLFLNYLKAILVFGNLKSSFLSRGFNIINSQQLFSFRKLTAHISISSLYVLKGYLILIYYRATKALTQLFFLGTVYHCHPKGQGIVT